jgi:DNA-binding response OmpR family regulator
MGATLLIVEDEPAILDFLADNLQQDEHRVVRAGTMAAAAAGLVRERPEIALIDVGLPDGSGFDLCRRIREGELGDPDVGIIMLTARAEEQDRVRGFQRGADDYVTKPFHYPELLARIGAVLKRVSRARDAHRLAYGELVVNMLSREVTVAGMRVEVSAKEFALLATLAADPERVFTKRELLQMVWDFRSHGRTRTLDSHASRLRQKLARHSDEGWIANVWGVGYRLCRPPE